MMKRTPSLPAHNKTQNSPRKKKILGATGALAVAAIAVTAIGGTAANWTNSESVGGNLDSGHFDLEVSVDEGQTWYTDTVENGKLDLSMSAMMNSDLSWAPGETRYSEVLLRLSEDSTHSGVLDFDNMVTVDGTGNVDDFSWRISDTYQAFDEKLPSRENCGYDYSGGSKPVEISYGDSFTESIKGDIDYFSPTENRPLLPQTWTAKDLGRTYLTHPAFGSPHTLSLCFEVSSKNTLAQNSSADAEWTMSIEQTSKEEIAYTERRANLMNEWKRERIQESDEQMISEILLSYFAIGDVEKTRALFEEVDLLDSVPAGFSWDIESIVDYLELSIQEDYEMSVSEVFEMIDEALTSDIEYYRESFGVNNTREYMNLVYGKEAVDLLVSRTGYTFSHE